MWAIIGLGNPGIRYKWSRHNIGFQVIDTLAHAYKIRLKKDRFIPAITGKGKIEGKDVLLIKPITYMNRSGIAIKGLRELYGKLLAKVLIVSDDIDLPWGRMRIRKQGSSAGHRGVQSIIQELATTFFPRVRMGVGRPANCRLDTVNYVLGRFSAGERKELELYCARALAAIEMILDDNIDGAMNKFN